MGSKGSRRGPLKTPPIKSYSVKGLAHSAGFGVYSPHPMDLGALLPLLVR